MSNRYIDKYYDDDGFLIGLTQSIEADTGDGATIQEFLDKEKIDFSQDLTVLEKATQVGPDFDIRFAGGVYKIDSNAVGGSEMFVHSVDRKIFLDGEEVKSQENKNGQISFTTVNNDVFEITFDCAVGEGVTVDLSERSFTGHVKPASSPNEPSPVGGKIYFPSNEASTIENDPSPTQKTRDAEGGKHLAVALDLVSNPSDLMIDDGPEDAPSTARSNVPMMRMMSFPIEDAATSSSPRHKKRGMFRKSGIAQHMTNLSPAMFGITATVGIALTVGATPAGVTAAVSLVIGYVGNQAIKKTRKVYQEKITEWVKSNIHLDPESVEAMLKEAADRAANAPEAEGWSDAEVVVDAIDKLYTNMGEVVWAEMYRDAAGTFKWTFRLSKTKFLKGFKDGVKDWIEKNHSKAVIWSKLQENVERVRGENARRSEPLDFRMAMIRREMRALNEEKGDLINEMNENAKFSAEKAQNEASVKKLEVSLKEELKSIEDSLLRESHEAVESADKAVERLRERVKELRERHGERPHDRAGEHRYREHPV